MHSFAGIKLVKLNKSSLLDRVRNTTNAGARFMPGTRCSTGQLAGRAPLAMRWGEPGVCLTWPVRLIELNRGAAQLGVRRTRPMGGLSMFKSSLKSMLLGAALVLLASPAFAQVQITSIIGNGTGCPANQGSVSAILQGNQASVIFGNYNVTTSANRPVQTKSCSVRVGLTFPTPGITLSVTSITWQGNATLSPGSQAFFSRSFNFVGQNLVNTRTNFSNTGNNPFTPFALNDRLGVVTFSSCSGASTILGANTTLSVMGPGASSIDTADVEVFSRMLLTLRISNVRC
jgi:hypothetical protein